MTVGVQCNPTETDTTSDGTRNVKERQKVEKSPDDGAPSRWTFFQNFGLSMWGDRAGSGIQIRELIIQRR